MICPACRIAGDENKRGEYEAAELNHQDCAGDTRCDCQHKTGVRL
jgi:hypothetical protein